MKSFIAFLILICGLSASFSQNTPTGPSFGNGLLPIFGTNTAFSANLQFQVAAMTITGKFYSDDTKTRFEIGLDSIQGITLMPSVTSQMKAMGMGDYIVIDRPDDNISYMVYPGMSAYIPSTKVPADFADAGMQMQTTDIGQVMVNGHVCDKKTVVITNSRGQTRTFTAWFATDLSGFPVQIRSSLKDGSTVTMLFKNVVLGSPDSTLFDAPSGYKKYDSAAALMLSVISTTGWDTYQPNPNDFLPGNL